MINIISRSIVSDRITGPRKVVENLIKGLNQVNYPYVINAALEATKTIWIHDDPVALEEAMKLPKHVAIVAGPNIYTLPNEIPNTINLSRIIWIHPAPWVKKFWNEFSTKEIPSEVWPVGIDTEKFSPEINEHKDLILVYNKQRSETEVETIRQALESRREKYEIITYGKYQEIEYRNLLKKAKAVIWVGRSESQGIALLEALASNVPALIWDINNFGHWTGHGHQRFTEKELTFKGATTAPYFNNQCGLRFVNKNELDINLSELLNNISTYEPRKYIEENLSLSKQANLFLNIYRERLSIDDSYLKSTAVATKKMWRNNTRLFKIFMKTKDAIRDIIR